MTPSDLDEIRKRCEAATEGPWTVEPDMPDVDAAAVRASDDSHGWPRFVADPRSMCLADAIFIAHARADVPRLLDEVERLNRIVAAPPGCSGCGVELGDSWCAKCATEAERDRLRGEVERLQRERDEAVAGRQCWKEACRKTEAEREANGEQMDRWWRETQTLRARLALLEPVWEAAKQWRRRGNPDECWELCDAIDAAVAKEGK